MLSWKANFGLSLVYYKLISFVGTVFISSCVVYSYLIIHASEYIILKYPVVKGKVDE